MKAKKYEIHVKYSKSDHVKIAKEEEVKEGKMKKILPNCLPKD